MTSATAVVCAPLLGPAECDALREALADASWSPGVTYEADAHAAALGPRRRCALTTDLPAALVARVVAEVARLGPDVFGLALTGVDPGDPVQVMRYGPGDGFDWHVDCGVPVPPYATRKLSFSLQLDPPDAYRGGDLELAAYQLGYAPELLEHQRAAARAQGTLIVFAAFQLHRVTPVTHGLRHALVGWLHGPPFT